MIPRELHCTRCQCDLSSGLDTYGDPGQEFCQGCWNALHDYEEYQLMRNYFHTNVGWTLQEVAEEYHWIDVR